MSDTPIADAVERGEISMGLARRWIDEKSTFRRLITHLGMPHVCDWRPRSRLACTRCVAEATAKYLRKTYADRD